MKQSQSRSKLVKAALLHGLAGSGLGIFWILIGSAHAGKPSPQVAFVGVAGGFVGGLVWFFTGRLHVRGRWWDHARSALIGMTVCLVLILTDLHDATPQVVLVLLPLSAMAGVIAGWYYRDYEPPGSHKKEK